MIVIPLDRIEVRDDRAHREGSAPLAIDGTARNASAFRGLALRTGLPGLLRTGIVA
jgi:hypothetical protein